MIVEPHVIVDATMQYSHSAPPSIQPSVFLSYLPLVAPVVVILTFTIDRIIASRIRKKESKRNWYLKAYFENSVKKVDEFFEASENMMIDSLEAYSKLNRRCNSSRNYQKKIVLLAEVNSKYTDLKRKFEINVLSVFNKQYPEIKAEVESSLRDFEDACSTTFDDSIAFEDKFYHFIDKIYQIKANLIAALSTPVITKNKSWFKRLKVNRFWNTEVFP